MSRAWSYRNCHSLMSGRAETEKSNVDKIFSFSPQLTHMIVIQRADRVDSPAGGVVTDNILLVLVETFQSQLFTNISATRADNERENKSQD